jgi:O-antigen ligase
VAQRLILARVAVDMAMRYPVFGAGPLNFRPLLYGDPYYKSMFRLGVAEVFDAHNFYLTTLATLGVAGLVLLLMLLIFAVRQLASGFGPAGWTSGALTVCSLWAAFLVGGFFGFSLLDPVSDILFAFLLSAVLVVCPFGGERSFARHDGQDLRAR